MAGCSFGAACCATAPFGRAAALTLRSELAKCTGDRVSLTVRAMAQPIDGPGRVACSASAPSARLSYDIPDGQAVSVNNFLESGAMASHRENSELFYLEGWYMGEFALTKPITPRRQRARDGTAYAKVLFVFMASAVGF